MRIMFDDDHGVRIAMECSSIAALPDPDSDRWDVLAVEVGATEGCIVRCGLSEVDAKEIVRKLFECGRFVQDILDS